RNLQTLDIDEEGRERFAAFQRLSPADAIIVTAVESRLVYRGIVAATLSIILISFVVTTLSIFFMVLYSRTISLPIKALAGAAAAVQQGDYLIGLKVKARDEIGALTESFIAMGRGLVNFERFTNKQIVALARKGSLSRTGENRRVTICFAMIREFEKIAKGMSPAGVVRFVNRFLARIVPCVTKTGGLVDKFLTESGLVVMAVWGLFSQGEVSPESDTPAEPDTPAEAGTQSAFNCLRSALLMRGALRKLNRKRLARGYPLVKMGCGINSGEVVAGQMGSDERMEWTVIGDAVNLASRIEGPNEVFDTDILITGDTYNLVGDRLITEEMPGLEVKGKSGTLRVFSVVNFKNHYGPTTMEEVRLSWAK
ncbi:MAG: HAMP domain-containing protein, partial [Spirochaetales bacterium]|nr:HAMP domain-containing protein [Spirochaetales bacterium]